VCTQVQPPALTQPRYARSGYLHDVSVKLTGIPYLAPGGLGTLADPLLAASTGPPSLTETKMMTLAMPAAPPLSPAQRRYRVRQSGRPRSKQNRRQLQRRGRASSRRLRPRANPLLPAPRQPRERCVRANRHRPFQQKQHATVRAKPSCA